MTFNEISPKTQDTCLQLLQNHLNVSAINLEKDKCVLPMLMTTGETKQLISLQPKSGKTDVDAALEVALQMLKTTNFENALFSYSTKIGTGDGNFVDALKTFIFEKSGLTVVFFTPYKLSGLFKKKVEYEKSIIGEIIENIFK